MNHEPIHLIPQLQPTIPSAQPIYPPRVPHPVPQPRVVQPTTITPVLKATITYVRIVPDKTDCAILPTIKTHLNSTISTSGADIKNICLAKNHLKRPEFMQMHISDIPTDIINQYNLTKILDKNGIVYIRIDKGMYGLRQAGNIAHNNLKQYLHKHVYHPCKFTKGLWHHISNSITFVFGC